MNEKAVVTLVLFVCCIIGGIFLYKKFGNLLIVRSKKDIKLENFDDYWGALGDPVAVEKKFYELLPQAEALKNKSIYLQLLSQIALTQAMQKKFDAAHKTLDHAEKLLTPDQTLAQARVLLERGRVFHQEALQSDNKEKLAQAKALFEKSFEFSRKNRCDYEAINAAHMVAIVADDPKEKIMWNERAVDIAQVTRDARSHLWFGSLYNNLGQNYLAIKEFDKALAVFKRSLEYRKKENYQPNIRVAQWAIAHTLRLQGRTDEALVILNALIEEYEVIVKGQAFDMPFAMLTLARGWVYEDLAEIYAEKTKAFSHLALEDLQADEMFKKTSPERLERLKQLAGE